MSDATATTTTGTATGTTAVSTTTQAGTQATTAGLGQSWWQGWVKPDGSLDHAAIDKAPDNIKSMRDSLGVFTKFDDLVDSYGHQRKMLSGKGLMPLRADASDSEKQAHRATLRKVQGVPDQPDGYGIKRPDNIPEELWDDGFASGAAKLMHEHDFSPAQAAAISKFYNDYIASSVEGAQAEEGKAAQMKLQQANEALNKEWGLNRPRMEALAVRGALTGGVDVNSDLFKDPQVQILCARFARMVAEDKLVAHPDGRPPQATVQEQWQAMQTDPKSTWYEPLWNTNHPRHEEAKRMFDSLAQQLGKEMDSVRSR